MLGVFVFVFNLYLVVILTFLIPSQCRSSLHYFATCVHRLQVVGSEVFQWHMP